jgi:hypothetical protein
MTPVNVLPKRIQRSAAHHQWLNECISNHSICAQKSDDDPISAKFLPTRLLDIQTPCAAAESNPHCKVVVTSETAVQGPYATLSHCWGTEPIKTLKISTIEDMKRGIIISEFPKTFQDAIVIARQSRTKALDETFPAG